MRVDAAPAAGFGTAGGRGGRDRPPDRRKGSPGPPVGRAAGKLHPGLRLAAATGGSPPPRALARRSAGRGRGDRGRDRALDADQVAERRHAESPQGRRHPRRALRRRRRRRDRDQRRSVARRAPARCPDGAGLVALAHRAARSAARRSSASLLLALEQRYDAWRKAASTRCTAESARATSSAAGASPSTARKLSPCRSSATDGSRSRARTDTARRERSSRARCCSSASCRRPRT